MINEIHVRTNLYIKYKLDVKYKLYSFKNISIFVFQIYKETLAKLQDIEIPIVFLIHPTLKVIVSINYRILTDTIKYIAISYEIYIYMYV